MALAGVQAHIEFDAVQAPVMVHLGHQDLAGPGLDDGKQQQQGQNAAHD